jgi:hypothetical protein
LGGKYFMNFSNIGSYGMYGSWGLLESQLQEPSTAPKFQAVMDFISNHPKWW